MTLTKMHGVLSLFVLLVIVLMVKPIFYNNMYNNVLGRVVLIAIMLFFATNNVTLGLLVALIIIIGTNMVFVEGMTKSNKDNENQSDKNNVKSNSRDKNNSAINSAMSQLGGKGRTIGDDSQSITSSTKPIQVTTSKSKSKDGVDKLALAETMQSIDSNTIPLDKSVFTGDEVEAMNPSDLMGSNEGFASNSRVF